jgi:hypothetical protein
MRFAYRSLLFVLVSSLLSAQDSLPGAAAAADSHAPASGGGVSPLGVYRAPDASMPGLRDFKSQGAIPSSGVWDSARLALPFSRPASLGGAPVVSGMPLAFAPEPQQSSGRSAAQTPPKEGNWVRRHAVLLAGLAMTGGGAALMATGGPGQFTGCLNAGPYGQTECTTASTWGASDRHIAGLLLACTGVPIAILGLIKHH